MFLPYVYKVTHRKTGEFYIGMRSANKVVAELDFGIKYFTSSSYVKNNFTEFDSEIIAYFKDQESAFYFENELIKENWNNELLLNKHYQKSMSVFSMAGSKRPDLANFNSSTKTKPKENRTYVCLECNQLFTKLEFIHKPKKATPICSRKCNGKYRGKLGLGKKNPSLSKTLRGRSAWNKGIPNPLAAENGKKGASKLSEKVTGRKRLYKPDGTWTWEYPKK